MLAGCLAVAALSYAAVPEDRRWVLAEDRIGELPLRPGAAVSARSVREAFPELEVAIKAVHASDEGCYVDLVAGGARGVVFRIRSYADCSGAGKVAADDPDLPRRVDLVIVESPRVVDAFGLRVGDGYRDIVRLRGRGLSFGAGHHDVHLGRDRLWYEIEVPAPKPGEPDRSPTGVRLEELEAGNWRVRSISWPRSSW